MAYNAHAALRDYYTYEQIFYMPICNLLDEIAYITPKLNEIARRQQNDKLQAAMTGKENMRRPSRQ